MKVLSKEDLLTLLNMDERRLYDLRELNDLLNKYGDDWFIEGNQWVLTTVNENMAAIKAHITNTTVSISKGE